MKETIRWFGDRSGPAAEAVSAGKGKTEEVGGRTESGQGDPAGCASKKISEAIAPPPSDALAVRHISSESAPGVPQRPGRRVDSSIPEHLGARTTVRLQIREIPQARVRYGVRQDPSATEA